MLVACNSSKNPKSNLESVASPLGTEVFQPEWENMAQNYRFPEWFRDGKFGIFIHWGVYSVPAFTNEWYPRNMYQKNSDDSAVYKYHIDKYGPQDKFGYKDFIPMFKAEKFNAEQWAALFKASGAKYVVPVAEHHDGFAMYNSDLNEWNSVKMGPKKDIIGLLKSAVEKEGLVFGLSTHRAENAWFYNGGMQFPSDVQDLSIKLYGGRLKDNEQTEALAREWLERSRELVDKYQPSLVWFDWTVNNPVLMPYFNKFMAYYYNNALDWGKGVVVNTKEGYPNNIQVGDVERGKLGRMRKYPWQTDTSVGKHSWCYVDGEENKTPDQIIHDLIDIVSKNGNLLLNIGPRADGTITEEQTAVLLAIGEWLKVNGEAIYGTRCWIKSGEGEVKSTAGSFTDNEATIYTAKDMRFTSKGNDLYVIVLNGDAPEIMVTSLDRNTIADARLLNVELLGSAEKISWQQNPDGLKLIFPKDKPDECAYSFKLSFDKPVGAHLPSEMIDVPLKHGDNTLPGLRKLMDIYLRDPSICMGPDSTWYLTGTINPPEGIKVWRSYDLVKWESLGVVWKPGASPWHKPYLKQGIPLWAPEIHYINNTFWITYSMPGWNANDPESFDPKNSGCGLLKSTTGKPEGPYLDVQPDKRMGDEIDASLFQDDDGSVYFLWHSGKIAKMKPDMSGLAEPYHWLKLTVGDPDPSHHSSLCPLIFGKDSFDHIGYEGMFMFKTNGLYYLCGSDHGEGGRYSCYIATSGNIYGPYSERYEALPYCGHSVFFQDGKKQWWSTFFGSDPGAPWQEQPGILPVTINSNGIVSTN